MIISQKDSVCNKPFGAIPQKRERNKLNYNRSSAFRVDVRRLYFIGRWSMKLQVLALRATDDSFDIGFHCTYNVALHVAG